MIKSQAKSDITISFHGILSRNIEMHKLFDNIKRAAKADVPIYICGETGVGKELVAQAIHAESNMSSQPFVAVNVANFSRWHDATIVYKAYGRIAKIEKITLFRLVIWSGKATKL
jgi:DNA-binding NtrC family response regulator